MMNEQINENTYSAAQINRIIEEVANAAQIMLGDRLSDVILYGSYARGDQREWSDIDVMILVHADDLETNRIKNDLTERLWNLIYETNLMLSIVVVSAARYEQYKNVLPFYTNAAKDGRSIVA